MTSPAYDQAAADAAVQAQLAQQAASVTGDPSAAGVYGDPAGASAPPQAMDLSKAQATAVDVEALVAQLQELQARAQAAVDAANPAPAPPDYSLRVDSSAPGYLHDVVAKIEHRLSALEGKSGS